MNRKGVARTGLAHAAIAAVTYLPLLLSGVGRVNADTKSYLYIEPGRLMRRAAVLWDPAVGMGTVSHQIIGYLWPMGPFFWLAEAVRLPDWFAQRVWLASIMFSAGAGVLFLMRTIDRRGMGAAAAALAYALTPYSIAYAARVSALLLPWAGLPWLIGLTIRACRRGGWRHPALFALLTTTVGSINATALLFSVAAAMLWLPWAASVREIPPRRALGVATRTGLLTLGCNLWWMVALVIGWRFGVPVLQTTETIEAVSTSATATEVLRGLGNWFFYGEDSVGPWVQASVPYVSDVRLIVLSFALPVAALLSAAWVRWRERGYFVLLLAAGTVAAVGAYPYASSSLYGRGLKTLADASTFGMALRNAPRATPLVALATACLVGVGIDALWVMWQRLGIPAGLLAIAVAVGNFPATWQGTIVDTNLSRDEKLPRYWSRAAEYLDARGGDFRVLEVPGSDFASYRWGNTIDPITPGLIDRPWVARESFPVGSVQSVNLMTALDRRMQEGIWEPASLAPLAQLMGVGDIAVRSDLQFERYRTPRPRAFWRKLMPPPPGLDPPMTFGAARPNTPIARYPLIDEVELALPRDAAHPPPVAVFPVNDAVPIVRAVAANPPILLAGDGEGLVDAAAAGLLDTTRVLRYSGSLSDRALREAVAAGAEVVLTDSNRRRAQRWTIVRENYGYTERAGEVPLEPDPSDGRLELFAGRGDAVHTVAEHRGVRSVQATSYGNTVSYTPEDRPVLAVDGDRRTAWRAGGFADPVGERLVVELDAPVTASSARIVQPLSGARNRWITRARLRFDGGEAVTVALTEASREPEGQHVTFDARSFTSLEFEILATNSGPQSDYTGFSSVGLAELEVSGVRAEEVLRLPTRPLASVGQAAETTALTFILSRARANPAEPVRSDEERALNRVFSLPADRTFTITGTARLSADRDDATLDAILGRPGPTVAQSNARLPGDVFSRASKAIDGDVNTWWQPGLLDQKGNAIELSLGGTRTIDRLEMTLVADGQHSVPRAFVISGDSGQMRRVAVQPLGGDATIVFDPITTSTLRVEIAVVDPVTTRDYYTGADVALPVAIAELGVPGIQASPLPVQVPSTCRDDLISVDGEPVSVRLRGTTEAAERGDGIGIEMCDAGLHLRAGDHIVRSRAGFDTGVDIDRLVLRSPRAGRPPDGLPAGEPPSVDVDTQGQSRMSVRVTNADPGVAFWFVLGQSFSPGWSARTPERSLGAPQLVNGYANGWLVDPATKSFTIELAWQPQRWVWAALAASLLTAMASLVTVLVSRSHRQESDQRLVRGASDARRIRRAITIAVLAVAIAIGANPAIAGGAIAVAILVLRSRAAGAAVRMLPALSLAAAGAYTAIQQYRYRYPPGFEWAAHFGAVHWLALFAVASVCAIAVAEALTEKQHRFAGRQQLDGAHG